ncbi:hypothetical protein GQR58_013636 [Nymphon striatum]|nr:hypothetical protein GQR58_013636 [Nymphon striatum]
MEGTGTMQEKQEGSAAYVENLATRVDQPSPPNRQQLQRNLNAQIDTRDAKHGRHRDYARETRRFSGFVENLAIHHAKIQETFALNGPELVNAMLIHNISLELAGRVVMFVTVDDAGTLIVEMAQETRKSIQVIGTDEGRLVLLIQLSPSNVNLVMQKDRR